MSKYIATAVVALVVGIVIGAAVQTAKPLGGVTIEDETFVGAVTVGGTLTGADVVSTDDITVGDDLSVSGDVSITGSLVGDKKIVALTATTTLTAAQSGSVFEIASGVVYTLPAVTNTGWNGKFVVGTAFADGNAVIDSAEGDNIDGTLIVAGAVVDCRGEDQMDFVVDGEQLGDYVEIYSDGTKWLIGDSGVLTAGKLTCTDPS